MKTITLPVWLFVASLLLASGALAQNQVAPQAEDTAHYPYWVEMMKDPNANFHATQSAFEKYWKGRTDYKGNGWKVFKRWEYINRTRVQPDGKLPSPGSVAAEYYHYQQTHSRSLHGNWTQVGPVALPDNATSQPNGMGRINACAFHPTDANTFFVGSPSGGLWKTTDAGTTWTTLTDNLPTLGVSAILIHPASPNIIYIGTGDRDAYDSPGMGVFKSTDGGVTFTPSSTGMGNQTISMMVMHPGDPNIILAATLFGLYKTTDGGATWTRKDNNGAYQDIKFKPGDPSIVYTTANGHFYRSTNTGETWTRIYAGVIGGARLVIGVSPSQPNWVYIEQENVDPYGQFAGLMKSTDSGISFTTQSTTPNIQDYSCTGSGNSSQAWYDFALAVDPVNANIIYSGAINIFKSTDAGVTWSIASHWIGSSWGESCAPSVHADIHSLDWSPLTGNLYTGCDGGFYMTDDGGTTWTDLSSGLAVAEIYKIGQSAQKESLCMEGFQDNGTASNNNEAFTTIFGGDGMECLVDYTDTNFRYGELYYGSIFRRSNSYNNYSYITGTITEQGDWVTPYTLNATNPNTMFAGYINVYRSQNVKAGWPIWTAISSGQTDPCYILETSPANSDLLYVHRNGRLRRSENANAASPTWINCALPDGFNPTALAAHPTDSNTLYATTSFTVSKSTDKGVSWTGISGTLPHIHINCIVYDKTTPGGLYVGNQTGIFYKNDTLSDWIPFNSGLPVTDVRELEIYYDASNPANNRIKAATYGRGLWESDLYSNFAVTPSNQDVSYSPPGTTQFSITYAGSWSAVSNSSWCIVPPSGTGNGTLVANYEVNPTNNTRIATIIVTPGSGMPISVTVTQAASTVGVNPGEGGRGIQMYPNPAKGYFTIFANEYKSQAIEVKLTDLTGRILSARVCRGQGEYRFDVSAMQDGSYLVRIKSDNLMMVRKLIINR